jgi:16S rRNA (uracil1498-N3)-methyltransferase
MHRRTEPCDALRSVSTSSPPPGHLTRPIATRFFSDSRLESGARIALSEAQAHQLRSVLRLEAGAAIGLFNPRDGEWRAELAQLGKRGGEALVSQRLRPPSAESDLWLLFAPIKGPRLDFIVEKATELGAAAILPVLTRRTVVSRVNVERLRAHAVEAAEQCERLSVPAVAEARSLDDVMATWPAGRILYVAAERRDARPLAQAIRPDRPSAAILTGPEGGFDPGELDRVLELGFAVPVGLGPRILRAETAAAAALAVWQAVMQPSLAGQPDRAYMA